VLLKSLMERFFGWKVLIEIPESKITVVKRKDDRILLYSNVIYSKLSDNSIYTHSYWDYLTALAAPHNVTRVLVLGLAGGTVPYQINKLFDGKASIDAVDVDRNMVKAMRVFLPERLKAKVIVEDGYDYVKRSSGMYDLVIFDMFKDLDIPKKFMSQDFIDRVYAMLSDDGVLAVNYVFKHSGMRQYGFKRRLGKRFIMYTISEPRLFGNRIFVCSKRLSKEMIIERMKQGLPEGKDNEHIYDGYRKMR